MKPIFFGNRERELADLILVLVVTCIVAEEVSQQILPYFTEGAAWTFREDNFYSYSSGLVRRAFLGEVLYRLDRVTQAGPLLLSLTMVALWVFVLAIATMSFRKTSTSAEQVAVYLSVFYIIYYVDAEIFILAPFIPIVFMTGRSASYAALLAVLVATLTREAAILFYAPLLLGFLRGRDRGLAIATFLGLAALFSFFLFYRPEVTYELERVYWPDRGVDNLTETWLYQFSELGLSHIVMRHLGRIGQAIPFIVPYLVFFFGYIAIFLRSRGCSAELVIWFLGTVSVFFVLTIDHGRYFYLMFLFCVLVSTDRGRAFFETFSLPAAPVSWLGSLLDRAGERARAAAAILFALSPMGFWVLETKPAPRLVHFIFVKTKKGVRMLEFVLGLDLHPPALLG